MKIVKRDGRTVEYDSDKIRIAISKANNEVAKENTVSEEQIENIIKYIESLKKKRMLVEDIQDIIEEKLMEYGKYTLAKQYIIYRYTRALVRKSNTTDETILSIIKNNNEIVKGNGEITKQTVYAQRDLIAGEISKDLTRRVLLPDKISKAHEEGSIFFHDEEYFLQPIFNTSVINIKDMLDNGTVINGTMIESPKTFQVACNILAQIIISVQSGQYGGLSIEMKHLGKYLNRSYNKIKNNLKDKFGQSLSDDIIEKITKTRVKEEVASGVQTIQYQINTLMTTSGKGPYVTMFLELDEQDEFIEENAQIIEEILRQRINGVKDEDGTQIDPIQPRLVYGLNECNHSKECKYYYLTELSIKCAKMRKSPSFLSCKKMAESAKGKVYSPMGYADMLLPYKGGYEGRFNQGKVTINLPQVALESQGNIERFWPLLDSRLNLCFEALMCRNHALLGTTANLSPIHYKYGAIARLESGEKVDRLLKDSYSTLSLGFLGLCELTKVFKLEYDEAREFAEKVVERLNDACQKWRKETGLGFVLTGEFDENVCRRLLKLDKEKYGLVKDVTNKEQYLEAFYIYNKLKKDIYEKMDIEENIAKKLDGGAILKVDITNEKNIIIEELIEYIYNNIKFVQIVVKERGE